MFTNEFSASNGRGVVQLAPPMPGEIIPHQLQGDAILAQSGAFLAAEPNVDIDTKFEGKRNFFRGKTMFLLKLSGTGMVFLDTYGSVKQLELEPGERYTVDNGHIVAFDEDVSYTTHKVGGLKGRFFSGEGRVSEFTGPGTVWVQNRNLEALAEKIAEKIPGGRDDDDGINVDF